MLPRDQTSASKVRAEKLCRHCVWLSPGVPNNYEGFPLGEAYIVQRECSIPGTEINCLALHSCSFRTWEIGRKVYISLDHIVSLKPGQHNEAVSKTNGDDDEDKSNSPESTQLPGK